MSDREFRHLVRKRRSLLLRVAMAIVDSVVLMVALVIGIVQFIWLAVLRRINHYIARKHA